MLVELEPGLAALAWLGARAEVSRALSIGSSVNSLALAPKSACMLRIVSDWVGRCAFFEFEPGFRFQGPRTRCAWKANNRSSDHLEPQP